MSLSRYSPLLFSAAAVCAAAQTSPTGVSGPHPHDELHQLENIVVTASPYARAQTELAQPTTVLAGRQLLLQQAPTVGELLAGQPGVSSTYFGPGASRPVIRGLAGDRIRLLDNGSGMIDASVISPDHAVSLDPLLIERVEVVRGPATLLYGGSAVGGVVNVIDHRIHTTRPAEPFNARIEARAGSGSDERSGGAVLEGGNGALAWHVDGYRRTAGNVEIPGFAESPRLRAEESAEAAEHGENPPAEVFGYIPNTALSADGAAAGFSLVGRQGYVGLAWSGHNTFYGIPGGAHSHGPESEAEGDGAEHEEAPVRIDLRQRRLDLQAAVTAPFGIFSGANFKLGIARYRHAEWEGDEVGTVFHNRGFDSRVELLHQPVGKVSGTLGWHGGRTVFEAAGEEAFLPPSRTSNQALFVLEALELTPFHWEIGGRVERQDVVLRDTSGIEDSTTTASASTGVVWTLNESWTLGTALSHTQRAPNAQELFAHGPHIGTNAYEIGDPALDPEQALTMDVTLRKRTGFVTGTVTVFANRFDGYIYEQPTGQVAVEHDGELVFLPPSDHDAEGGLPVYRFVQRDAEFFGAELETVFHLYHAEKQRFDLTLGADTVRARNTDDRTDLPRITPRRGRIGLTWTDGSWSAGADVQFVDAQDRIAPLETRTAGHALANAYVSYRLSLDRGVVDIYLRGSNLGDEEARPHTSFLKEVAPLPGRNFTLGLRATF